MFYSFMDTVINTYMIEETGVLSPLSSKAIGLCITSTFTYLEPAAFPGVIDCCLRVTKLGKSSVTYEVGVFQDRHEAAAAVGSFVHVFVDSDSRQSVPIPNDIRSALEALMQDVRAGD